MEYDAWWDNYFALTHFLARDKFNAAAKDANCRMKEYEHPSATDRKGWPLYTDVAVLGAEKPTKLLVNVSGLYGIDGFFGSAMQIAALKSKPLEIPDDTAVVFVHAINPWAFAHGLVMPKYWTSPSAATGLILRFQNRFTQTQAAFLSSQSLHADGFINGGSRLYWPRAILDKILSPYRESVRKLIQLYSGLNLGPQPNLEPQPKSEIILDSGKSAQSPVEARKIWPNSRISIGEDDGASNPLAGFYDDWNKARCVVVAHEVGVAKRKTDPEALMRSFRKTKPADARYAIREVFYPNDADWCGEALHRGLLTFHNALTALSVAS